MLTSPKPPSPSEPLTPGSAAAEAVAPEPAPAPAPAAAVAPASKAPLPPGAVRLVIVGPGGRKDTAGLEHLADAMAIPDAWTWIDATSPTAEDVARIGEVLGLHPLIAEDILEGNQRPKVEVTDAVVHIVLFSIRYGDELRTSEIDFVLGDRFLLTVHEPAWDPRAVHHLRGGAGSAAAASASGDAPSLAVGGGMGSAFGRGPDHLLWALVDGVVDGYFPCLDRIGDEVDRLQDEVIEETTKSALQRLFVLKRDLLAMRRAISPVREIFNQLTNRDLELIDDDEIVYFRDVYDHLIRITDELDTHRELVGGTLEVYLTTVNNNLSLIMKRLTGVTVILAGIGAVAGVFGMSEAASAINGGEGAGFWIITAGMALVALVAVFVLRRIGWI
jgi:magnesium transporter